MLSEPLMFHPYAFGLAFPILSRWRGEVLIRKVFELLNKSRLIVQVKNKTSKNHKKFVGMGAAFLYECNTSRMESCFEPCFSKN